MTLPPFPAELLLSRADLLKLRYGCCLALELVPAPALYRWIHATADGLGGRVRISLTEVGVIIDMLGISAKGPNLVAAANEWRVAAMPSEL